jgi:hypothetical protein
VRISVAFAIGLGRYLSGFAEFIALKLTGAPAMSGLGQNRKVEDRLALVRSSLNSGHSRDHGGAQQDLARSAVSGAVNCPIV